MNDGLTSLVQRLKRIGRNNARLHEIREQKKALKDKLDTLDDANTDLMMGEGYNLRQSVGGDGSRVRSKTRGGGCDVLHFLVFPDVNEFNDLGRKQIVEMNKLEEEESKLESRQALRK
ncbi:hypothetical protein PsorP6_012336 [Peronosclerospora sorghi]|uniref:Uncharacterized protein n=1 Tax=Peronosclerospora sorghi TaxID=230839 RepID=A0ACC0WH98_9STRA|nr:hypothetical protein PsorP6_012336 [Peronosclerospora sorghi]